MAFLKDRADADGELLAAGSALFQAVALNAFRVLLRRLGADALKVIDLSNHATVRARRLAIPDDAFDELESCGFVVEVGLGQNRHVESPQEFNISPLMGLSTIHTPIFSYILCL